MTISYQPLRGVRVLDIGILIPAALTSLKLAAMGADVVKVEQPPRGDRIRYIPDFGPDGRSTWYMGQGQGKRSIALDLKDASDRETFLALADKADVLVENQLAGAWERLGVSLVELRERRPELIICSITGFGQTGPLSVLPSHGMNVDALSDSLKLEWRDGHPTMGWYYTSWGNELGAASAAQAICAALLERQRSGQGAWIDISCWDAIVESHRGEMGLSMVTGQPYNIRQRTKTQPLYDTYLSKDDKPVLLGALEKKFWVAFCKGIEREDLIPAHTGVDLYFGEDDTALVVELREIFRTATADEWSRRFVEWDCPGCVVLQIDEVMQHPHFIARQLLEGAIGEWPNVASAIRWHHTGERAGSGLRPPPELDQDRESILEEWR